MKTIKKLSILLLSFITIIGCKEDENKPVQPVTLSCSDFESTGALLIENRGTGVDYIIDCHMEIYGDLTIESGVTIEFTDNGSISINETGSISAVGTEINPILFTAKDKVKGAWKGIYINSEDVKNTLQFCTIDYAASSAFNSNGDLGALVLWANTKVNISDCTISNSKHYGINASYEGCIMTLNNLTITNCAMPMFIKPNYVQFIQGGSFTGNTTDVIHLQSFATGEIVEAQTWTDLGLPYRVQTGGYLYVNDGAFRIEEGVTLEFESGTGLFIDQYGAFAAIGTAAKPILFTGVDKSAGSWGSIYFNFTNSPLNEISYATIEYGGEATEEGAIYMWASPDLKLNNVAFSNIESCAVFDSNSSANPNLNCVITNCTYTSVDNINNSAVDAANFHYCYNN